MLPSRSRTSRSGRRYGWIVRTACWIEDAPPKPGEASLNGVHYFPSDDGAPQVWDGRAFSQISDDAYPYKSKAKAERRAFLIAATFPLLIGQLIVERRERGDS